MKSYNLSVGAAVAILVVFFAVVVGWVMNVVELIGNMGSTIDTEFVLRLVGVFVAPLGAILGYF